MDHAIKAPDLRGWLVAAGCAVVLAGVSAGCATTSGSSSTDNGDGGDLPWATPANWEGSPSIPGISDR